VTRLPRGAGVEFRVARAQCRVALGARRPSPRQAHRAPRPVVRVSSPTGFGQHAIAGLGAADTAGLRVIVLDVDVLTQTPVESDQEEQLVS